MPCVFITGSGRRIGRALAIKFAERKWDVVIHYNKSKDKAEKTYADVLSHGVKAALVQGDVRKYKEMEKAFADAIDITGVPDVLVNNAAIYPPRKHLHEIDENFWDDTIDTNLKSIYNCTKIYDQYSIGGSHIVNFASLGGMEIWKGRIPYNVSKAGVIQLNKALARELAPKTAVNAVAPGTIVIPEEPADEPVLYDPMKIPAQRFGNVDDIFQAVYFFSTCSLFITGQLLAVDGGHHLVK